MDEEFLSIKIKDGLFIGNKWTASDLEFLVANRFKYVLNCTSEVKNYFESSNFIKYYKLKYSKHKPNQPLWKQNMKKFSKIMEFINTAEQDAECCLIHSNEGNNRCIAVVIAYLMAKYRWKFVKVLQFLQSKNIENRLSENYIKQLKALQQSITVENQMSIGWDRENLTNDELLITNTYMNSIQIPFKKINSEHKKEKKVQWKDRIQKQQKQQKLEKQEKSKKQLLKQQPKQKVQKRMAKSQIIQVKKYHLKSSNRQAKEKQKNTHRPSSSFSKSYIKKNKEEQLSQKLRGQQQKQEQEELSAQSEDISTQDLPHNNRLINNFLISGDEPKRTSKMAPRKSQQNSKMTRAFSEKDYSSFKDTRNNANIPVNTSKQSLKASIKGKQKGQLPPSHFKSTQQDKLRGASPKSNVRYKN